MTLSLVEFPSAEAFYRRLLDPRVAAEPRGSVHGPDVTVFANFVRGELVVDYTREVSR